MILVAALAVLAVTVVAAGARTPGYDPWRDTISLLASDGQPHALAVRVALLLPAAAIALVAGRQRGVLRIALVGAALAGVVAAVVPKDLPGTSPSTLASQVHVAAAVVGGGALVVAMLLRRATAAAVVTVAAAVVFQRTWGTPVHGAVERVLVAVPLLWCTTIGGPIDRAPWRSPSKA